METYIALKDFSVEQTPVPKGATIGKGDAEAGKFTPEKGFEVIEAGHVCGRLGLSIGVKGESAAAPKLDAPKAEKPKTQTRTKAKRSTSKTK